MAITAADMKYRFPEFGALDAATLTRWIDEAELHHNACQWGSKSNDGLAYLTAHLLSLFAGDDCGAAGTTAAGPLQASTEGRVSATWAVPEMFTEDDLGASKYGRRYLSMVRALFVKRCT